MVSGSAKRWQKETGSIPAPQCFGANPEQIGSFGDRKNWRHKEAYSARYLTAEIIQLLKGCGIPF
ncbi:MAG: hypothetical protein ACFFD2_03300 [Promethearchaeota archaeon]